MKFFHTIYGKIAVIFLFLITIISLIQLYVALQAAVDYSSEANQKVNYMLASDLAKRCQPDMKDSMNVSAMRGKMEDMMLMNPHVDIYFLDEQGNIIMHSVAENKLEKRRVDIQPIQRFIDKNSNDYLPIFGDDPRFAGEQKGVFSAATIHFPSGYAYLYIILASQRYEIASEGVKSSYILRTTGIVFVSILITGAFIGLVLFFLITKRLRQMTFAVRALEKGDYQKRIPVKSDDELGELASAFNHMASTIEKNVAELKRNDLLRRELVANISHDLRSPLSSVQGYLETILIKDNKLDTETRNTFLKTALKNIGNLNHLVQQLFELAKFDAMEIEPKMEPFAITELAQDIMLKFQQKAEQKNVRLQSRFPRNLPMVRGDLAMMERVLSNLIDNAIRYTPPDGEVILSLQRLNDNLQIKVSDTGVGIPEKDLPNIFSRFYRVEKSRNKASGGSGLGLAITKKILEIHGSNIEVTSRERKGTVFSFTLPVMEKSKVRKPSVMA
ncbi:MAG: HAMP domain-containing protein [Caldithrix sp.]|nr:HAMP domain-containing protein [Caldithrix sp.]